MRKQLIHQTVALSGLGSRLQSSLQIYHVSSPRYNLLFLGIIHIKDLAPVAYFAEPVENS